MGLIDFLRGRVPPEPRSLLAPDWDRDALVGLARRLMTPARMPDAVALALALPEGGAEAWEACAARSILPDAWIGDPRRCFVGPCGVCQGLGTVYAGQSDYPCLDCDGFGLRPLRDPLSPRDRRAAAVLASHVPEVAAAEAIAREVAVLAGPEFPGLDAETLYWWSVAPFQLGADGITLGGYSALKRCIEWRPETLDFDWVGHRDALVVSLGNLVPSPLAEAVSPSFACALALAFGSRQVPEFARDRGFADRMLDLWQLGFGLDLRWNRTLRTREPGPDNRVQMVLLAPTVIEP